VLVQSGPYRWLRHPIYASIIYFFLASVISYPKIETIIAFAFIAAGLYARMIFEEGFLLETYPEYAHYCKQTKRIIPYLY
jgi:protein-S-isoprenylcysteine O-methyltransferase Ste14